MTSFGMLMNSPDSEFQRISPKNTLGNADSEERVPHENSSRHADMNEAALRRTHVRASDWLLRLSG
jgi:hypothetical protein